MTASYNRNGRRFQTQSEYRTYFNRYIRPQWGSLLLEKSDFVFAADSGRPGWQGMILNDYVRPAAVKAGLGNVGWHTFRHSYRPWLKRFAAPAEIQKDLMRHSNLKTTLEIYGIEPDVASAHCEANSGVVRALLGKSSK